MPNGGFLCATLASHAFDAGECFDAVHPFHVRGAAVGIADAMVPCAARGRAGTRNDRLDESFPTVRVGASSARVHAHVCTRVYAYARVARFDASESVDRPAIPSHVCGPTAALYHRHRRRLVHCARNDRLGESVPTGMQHFARCQHLCTAVD